jgi:hypothetical protein
MKTAPKKKVTIMLDNGVYEGLRQRVGARGIGAFLSQLARPHVSPIDLEAGYKALAADEESQRLAKEWLEGTDDPIEDENAWRF